MLGKSQTFEPRPKEGREGREGRDRWAVRRLQDKLGPSQRHKAPPFVARCEGAGAETISPAVEGAVVWLPHGVPQAAVVPPAPHQARRKQL